ncbi:hypothetical protein [Polyangium spumosum]|uniref:Uncharacterized protein n=1 Tax=Polyangium spumosum TaxID=889282 RepID=A0A6N7PIL8_9BACT|nr:hypothetical protein [Polyangium spumosum]MRG91828.1 hypothetical protein [Polyangium spumosum]
MYTDEDRRRLLESRHDISACDNPALLTPKPTFQSAVLESRDELASARVGIQSATGLVSRERTETDTERARLEEAVLACVRRYAFVRGKVQDVLLNVDPDMPLPASERERRQRLFDRVFGTTPSDLGRMSQGNIVEVAGGVADALAKEPDLAQLGLAEGLAIAHAAARDAAKELNREADEDTQAMLGLRAARDAFDRAASAHALFVESLLARSGRKDEIGQFVLARDAAYAARRAARVPVSEEPGANEIDEPPVAPTP